jgi:hypothetical protein
LETWGAFSSQDDSSSNNARPYMIGSNAYLTQVQEDKVKEIVQAINSDIPIHVTVMAKSHVYRKKCGFVSIMCRLKQYHIFGQISSLQLLQQEYENKPEGLLYCIINFSMFLFHNCISKKTITAQSGMNFLKKLYFVSNLWQDFIKRYGDYLPQEKQIVVLQLRGERWKMWLNDARTKRGRRLIHGWRQFVMDNDLQIGDICLFDLINDKKICTISVHIIRARKRVADSSDR